MATTFFSTQRALAQLTPKGLIDSNDVGAVKCAFFDYTPPAASAPVAGDFIELCTLPIGAKVVQVQMAWAAQVSTCQLSIGIASSAAKYMVATVATSAGVKVAPTLLAEANLSPTTAETILIAVTVAGIATTTGVIKGAIFYVL